MICFLEELFDNDGILSGVDDFSDDADFDDPLMDFDSLDDFKDGGIDSDTDLAGDLDASLDDDLFADTDFDNDIQDNSQVSFTGKYSQEEIERLKRDVSDAKSLEHTYQDKLDNLKSKLSLNDTEEHRKKGDYDYVLGKLNEAKQRLNDAKSKVKDAKSLLNDAT